MTIVDTCDANKVNQKLVSFRNCLGQHQQPPSSLFCNGLSSGRTFTTKKSIFSLKNILPPLEDKPEEEKKGVLKSSMSKCRKTAWLIVPTARYRQPDCVEGGLKHQENFSLDDGKHRAPIHG
uniref:Uncharacterized protein n=1 Tax=Romanomermis culicivorax TaxID=13658 RepID=A0A915KQN2_ROMCU